MGRALSLSKREFCAGAKRGKILPLYLEVPYCPPSEIYQIFEQGRGSILLESVNAPSRPAHPKIGRYSFFGFEPYASIKMKDSQIEVEVSRKRAHSRRERSKIFDRLRDFMEAYKQEPVPDLPPFQGGALGLISYDFVHYFEHLPRTTRDDLNVPDAFFFMYDRLIAWDHIEKKSWLIICPGARDTGLGYGLLDNIDWAKKYDEAERELQRLSSKVKDEKAESQPTPDPSPEGIKAWVESRQVSPLKGFFIEHTLSKDEYMEIVRRAKEYIAAGDIFQANLSLRVDADIGETDPWTIYRVLSRVNPSPFACYMDFGEFQIASSSPERLICVREGMIETRPIAGTRPRGRDGIEDEAMRAELLLNEKEKAEHIMLIDLERNDIGKVSGYGTVSVDEFMVTEDYSHVIHIVSNIEGKLAPGKTLFDSIRATFPGGTITGVPKVRCMEIIDELEPTRRGPYTGGAGYLGFSGSLDLNILIRTFLIKNGRAHVQAGAGIVADSIPEREYYESLKKAEALLLTLKMVKDSSHPI
jgi:anthranilate/para-aminobenzoate synthase component I